MSMDVWANMAILLLYGSLGMRQRYSMGSQRDTPGFGASQTMSSVSGESGENEDLGNKSRCL